MRLSGDSFPAIDDFLPLLIYNIIKSNPQRLHSNVKYVFYLKIEILIFRFINRFQFAFQDTGKDFVYNESKDYEGEYWLRHFEAAILFIESLDPKELFETSKPNQQRFSRANSIKFLKRGKEV